MRACELECVHVREKREDRMKDRQSQSVCACVRVGESKRVCDASKSFV